MSSSHNQKKSPEESSLRDAVEMLSGLLEDESIPAIVRLTDNAEEPLEVKTGPLRFYFTTMGFVFAARADLGTTGSYLRISGDLGMMPYSAQSSLLRRCLLTVIRQEQLMHHCRLYIQDKNHIIMAGTIDFKGTQHQSILSALMRLLIDCRPHLSLFREYIDFFPDPSNPPSIPAQP